jgi:tellurite resistance protein TehA-like permease
MSDDQYPKPDAAAAAAIAKAKRLMALTFGLTFIALAIVLTIIGYRLFTVGENAPTVGVTTQPSSVAPRSTGANSGHAAD